MKNIVFARQAGSPCFSEFGVGAAEISDAVIRVLKRRGVQVLEGVILDSWLFDPVKSVIDRATFRFVERKTTSAAATSTTSAATKTTTTSATNTTRFEDVLLFFSFAIRGKDYDMFQVGKGEF